MKLIYLNVFDGCKENERFEKLVRFVRKEKPEVLGLSELKGWSENNFSRLKEFQEKTSFEHATFCTSPSGYHLALFSRTPFLTKKTLSEGFKNGAIAAVFTLKEKRVILILAHLDPRSEDFRLKELSLIQRQFRKTDAVILFGDLNSLSPEDNYGERVVVEMKDRGITKFGVSELRFDVISSITRLGFIDCIQRFSHAFEFSVPTPFNVDKKHFTKLRLDYVFAKNLSPELMNAKVLRNKTTKGLSDHYPVVSEFDA